MMLMIQGWLSAITGPSERPLGYQYLLTDPDIPKFPFRVIGFGGASPKANRSAAVAPAAH